MQDWKLYTLYRRGRKCRGIHSAHDRTDKAIWSSHRHQSGRPTGQREGHFRCLSAPCPHPQQSRTLLRCIRLPWILVSVLNGWTGWISLHSVSSRGMQFENVSILTENILDIIKEIKYCWSVYNCTSLLPHHVTMILSSHTTGLMKVGLSAVNKASSGWTALTAWIGQIWCKVPLQGLCSRSRYVPRIMSLKMLKYSCYSVANWVSCHQMNICLPNVGPFTNKCGQTMVTPSADSMQEQLRWRCCCYGFFFCIS